ncbi:uncharacterized protein UMAG_04936 [Mycosarcoma maydis]|uniref:FCP1 homology domain-containing protein n=1 Tax=Mycosarcoma maydis TaxID=5270 RepID=A0A0D1CJN8_MYCMD|nr:uncharacterized protein UMAG_04936 [Ustilago maydis 521]KIS67068.1 hypothetical protein UMAG_04936 [Ustilago maydis 521]|eukprot:XP_011391253.1 hypothetical protein UMAG_04936 [Ustilago maydis 521]
MSAPYRHPHYAASWSQKRPWVRGQEQDDTAVYEYDYNDYPRRRARAAYDSDAYRRDHYEAYAPAGYADYGHGGYDAPERYPCRDGYAYDQAHPYAGAPWSQNGYDAHTYPQDHHYTSYHWQPLHEAVAPRHAYEAQTLHPNAPTSAHASATQVWTSAARAPKGVHGAPAAPRAMLDAAAAASASAADSPASKGANAGIYLPTHAHLQQQQRQRDYHSYSPVTDSSRFRPYNQNSSSVRAKPMHASTSGLPTMRLQPPAMRAAPRPSYMEQAKQASRQLSEEEARDRKLLVILDLNGTLVFRAKSRHGRAKDSAHAVPRPFLRCFLQYCLGISKGDATLCSAKSKEIDPAIARPHGSHFWRTNPETGHIYEPCSAGNAHVVVWSSAQPANVDSMVSVSFDASIRSQLLRVWARDTLVPNRFYQHKAESVKDLEIVWAELNAFANQQASPGRLLAEARDQADQARPDDVPPPNAPKAPAADNKYRGKMHKQKLKAQKQQQQQQQQQQAQYMSASLQAAKLAEERGPWGAHNTVLVDDSVAKAKLQPYNQLLIPEFGTDDAKRMKEFIRHVSTTADAQEQAYVDESHSAHGAMADDDFEYDSDLSIGKKAVGPALSDTEVVDTVADASADSKPHDATDTDEQDSSNTKARLESQLDDVLLQTIGVLETLRYQSNVSAFIQSGGIEGYGAPKTAQNQEHSLQLIQQGATPEFWVDKGRDVCGKLGIDVQAWSAGDAASATAAL